MVVGKREPARSRDALIMRGTALGNPFRMRREAERDAVCDAYADWVVGAEPAHRVAARWAHRGRALWVVERAARVTLAARVCALSELATRVRRGESVRLRCHCAPKRCHGDVVLALVRQRV